MVADKAEPAQTIFREPSPELMAAADRFLAAIRAEHPETVEEPRALALASLHLVLNRTFELHKLKDAHRFSVLAKAVAANMLLTGINSETNAAIFSLVFNGMLRDAHREVVAAFAFERLFGMFRK